MTGVCTPKVRVPHDHRTYTSPGGCASGHDSPLQARRQGHWDAYPGGWLGGATLQVNGESCHVVYCSSALQVREALVALSMDETPQRCKAPHPRPSPQGEGKEAAAESLLIVITPLDEAQLGSRCPGAPGRAAVIPYRSLANGSRPLSCPRGRPTSAVARMARRGAVSARPPGGVSTGCQRIAGCRTVWKHLLTQSLAAA